MRLLALDASSTAVGWAEFDGADYVASGVYLPPGDDWHDRVLSIHSWLHDTLEVFDLDVLAYEIASGSHGNMATDRKLGAVEYVCWVAARSWLVRWLPVNVQQVKASGCSKQAIANAEAVAGHKLDKRHAGDEADAIGVALAALRLLKMEAMERAR